MQLEGTPRANGGREQSPNREGGTPSDGVCPACNAPLDSGALSRFAARLARFGLGATRQPLLSRLPELPNAE